MSSGQAIEVGWKYWGHPTPQQKIDALRILLDLFGGDLEVWTVPPEIRYQHADRVSISDWGRGPWVLPAQCSWMVYGILRRRPEDAPEAAFLKEGYHAPVFDDIREDLGV